VTLPSEEANDVRIGIDLGGTKIEGVVLAEDGALLTRRRVPTPRDSYEATVQAIADLVADLEEEVGGAATVGMGMPGTVSPLTRGVKNANSVWLNGKPFDRDVAAAVGRELRWANDANCLALSEAVDGAGAGERVVFAVILGTGVGAGLVVDGTVIPGRNGVAGEWGHNPLPWSAPDELPGPDCYCGLRGCIETWLSGPGLRRDHQRVTGRDLPTPEITAAAEAGDTDAEATLQRYEHRLARALAHVVNMIDPDVFVFGGGVSNTARLYDNVPPQMAQWVLGNEVTTPLRPAVHGDSSGVRGAAWLWPVGARPADPHQTP
jgi:fructokinase